MKLRSFLLVACMVVVPLMAMFSHKIPLEMRTAVREQFLQVTHKVLAAATDRETSPLAVASPAPIATVAMVVPPTASAPTPLPATTQTQTGLTSEPVEHTSQSPATIVMPLVTLAPINAIAPTVSPRGNGLSMPAHFANSVNFNSFEAAAPVGALDGLYAEPVAARIAPEPTSMALTPAEDVLLAQQVIQERLATLGAVSFECVPAAGAETRHRCSCRVAADPSGELQRVFQSTETTPLAAMNGLLNQVTAWRRRIALEPTATRPPQPSTETPARF